MKPMMARTGWAPRGRPGARAACMARPTAIASVIHVHFEPPREMAVAAGALVEVAAAMTDGRTAIEITPKTPAAAETAALWHNIQAWFQ